MTDYESYIWNKFWTNTKQGNYNSLSKIESDIIRKIHISQFNEKFPKGIYVPIVVNGISLLNDYDDIITGDHGCYIEFSDKHLMVNIETKPGQEFRETDSIAKYHWKQPVIESISHIKIYYQVGLVKYADYKIGKYYISIFDI